MNTLTPGTIKDRYDVYRFFNGITDQDDDDKTGKVLKRPSVKSFLLEHVASRNGKPALPIKEIWNPLDTELNPIDNSFHQVTGSIQDPETKKNTVCPVGFLEQFDERFFAYYTCEPSNSAQQRTARWVQSPMLDYTWFSGPLMQMFWEQDISKRGADKFGRLVFQHESIFDMPPDFALQDIEEELSEGEMGQSEIDSDSETDRRKARFEMKDKVGLIQKALPNLQRHYAPLNALYALRFPGQRGRGGHDLYQEGRITNRTESFEDHRNHVYYFYQTYKSILDYTEMTAWSKQQSISTMGNQGAPLIIKFKEPLSQSTLTRWMQLAFRKTNIFKLWGCPIQMGPSRYHVYGADRHLWQPLNMEISSTELIALLPRGTCGNTFHRLIANIQHYVSPEIDVWIGEKKYSEIINQWTPMQVTSK